MSIKILVYIPSNLDLTTGTRLRALNLSKALFENNCDVHVAAYSLPKDYGYLRYHKISECRRRLPYRFLKQAQQIKKLIKEIKPDILYTHCLWGMIPAVLAKWQTETPVIADLHSLFIEEAFATHGIKYNLSRLVDNFFVSQCDGIVVLCEPLREYYSKIQKKISVVPGGADLNLFNHDVTPAHEITKLSNDHIIVTYIGNFNPYQGVGMLLEAACEVVKKNNKYFFVLVGDNSQFPEYASFIKNNKLESSALLLGKKDVNEVPSYLSASDILVVPRPYTRLAHYAFASKLPEYLAMGKAVIATDVGDACKLVQDMDTGLLIKPNKDELAEALLKLEDKNLRLALGCNARQLAAENYSWVKLGGRLKKYLQEILQGNDR